MKFKRDEIVYHQNTGSVPYKILISYQEQSEIIRIDSGEMLLCDNQYLTTPPQKCQEMRDKVLDFILNEEEVKNEMKKEDE